MILYYLLFCKAVSCCTCITWQLNYTSVRNKSFLQPCKHALLHVDSIVTLYYWRSQTNFNLMSLWLGSWEYQLSNWIIYFNNRGIRRQVSRFKSTRMLHLSMKSVNLFYCVGHWDTYLLSLLIHYLCVILVGLGWMLPLFV